MTVQQIQLMDQPTTCKWVYDDQTVYYFGSQLLERYLLLQHCTKILPPDCKIGFTSFSGCLQFDAFIYSGDTVVGLIEVKVRQCNSTTYDYPMCEIKRYHELKDLGKVHSIPTYYVSIWNDGKATWNDLQYCVTIQRNYKRKDSDTYHTNKTKNYGHYLINEYQPIVSSIPSDIYSEVDSLIEDELNNRGYKVPVGFTLKK